MAVVTSQAGLILLLFPLAISGCGITTHHEVSDRALQTYENPAFGPGVVRRILTDHLGALQAGSTFPDSQYNSLCNNNLHFVSEDMHWAPFFEVAWRYFKRTYPEPFVGNADAENLLAFLFGMLSHHTSDISWHGLEGLQNSIMDAVDEISEIDANSLMDFGGDIIGVYQWDTSYATHWHIPSADILAILTEYYGGDDHGLTEASMEACAAWLLAGRTAEQLIGSVAYPYVRDQSVTFLDEIEDYYLGGINDMAAWTQLVWDNSLSWYLNYDNCLLSGDSVMTDLDCAEWGSGGKKSLADADNGDEAATTRRRRREFGERKRRYLEMLGGYIDREDLMELVEVKKEGRGARISINDGFKEGDQDGEGKMNAYATPSSSIYSSRANSNLGYAVRMGDINGDLVGDLVIGAPTYVPEGDIDTGGHRMGCVFVVLGTGSGNFPSGDVESAASTKICDPLYVHSRFGHSLALADLNGDSILDIVVGAPAAGSDELNYHGAVWELLVGLDKDGNISLVPRDIRVSATDNGGLGWSVASNAGTSDYVVAARHLSATGTATQEGALLGRDEIIVDQGATQWEWFGHSVIYLNAITQRRLIAVGSPTYSDCSQSPCVTSTGKVSIIDLDQQGTVVAELVGERDFQQFGYSLAAGPMNVNGRIANVLAVGSPTDSGREIANREEGSVQIFELVGDTSFALVAEILGPERHSRFGHSLVVEGGSHRLMVGCPRYHGFEKEHGAVFIYEDAANNPATIQEASDPVTFFGASIHAVDGTVVVSAPRSSRGGKAPGEVYVYTNV